MHSVVERQSKARQGKAGGEGKGKGRGQIRKGKARQVGKGRQGKAGEEGRKGKAKARRCDELTLCCAAATSSLTAFMTATLYMAWASLPPTANRSLCSSKSAHHAWPHVSLQQP